jgi:hypothetical protein
LPDADGIGNRAQSAVAWVPATSAQYGGFFYVGSQYSGKVFIYELPLTAETGPNATATLRRVWEPKRDAVDLAGLACADGLLFVAYRDKTSCHVLVFEVTPTTGEARELRDQYLLDVPDVQGVASRRIARGHFDVVLTSETQHRIYAYEYKFIKGFSEHRSCRPRLAVGRTNRCALLALLLLLSGAV